MGCACTKPEVLEDAPPSPKVKSSLQSSARYSNASVKGLHSQPLSGLLLEQQDRERRTQQHTKSNGVPGAIQIGEPVVSRRRERRQSQVPNPRLGVVPKNAEGEHVAAGWPAWLSAVAGEAIRGWIPRRADSFEKLDKIGQGTYSNVYKARDLDSRKIVALKKVRFDNLEPESVKFMAREILVLRRLDHSNVIKLEGLVTSRMSCSLYLVFEYMEHDLAGLAACPGITFTEPQVKCYVHQLLSGLEHCHTRGVLHRDIKGSNLLLDNTGLLKIADFGLATFFYPDKNQTLTSRVVTLWYRPPELLLGATEYGVGVDLWSVGCILAELLAGKPIMPGRTEVEQLHKIFKLCGSPSEEYWKRSKLPHATIFKPQQPYKRCIAETFKDFPASALTILDKLLAIEPADRGTASDALNSEFFSTKPYACDPSSLPQYPPSKEMDAKIRDEENRRQRGLAVKSRDVPRRVAGKDRGSRAIPAPEANAELQVNLQRRRVAAQSNVKSKSEKFPPPHEDSSVGFLVEPPRQGQSSTEQQNSSYLPPPRHAAPPALSSHSGPMGPPTAGQRKKRHGVEDVRMAPPRLVNRVPKSVSVNAFASQSGDFSHLSNMVSSRDVNTSDIRKSSRDIGDTRKSGHRHRDKADFMVVGKQGGVYSKRLEQVEVAQLSESFRGSSVLGKDVRPPLRPSSLAN